MAKAKSPLAKIKRPMPPLEVQDEGGYGLFLPAPELEAWLRREFIEEGGALYRVEHSHLKEAHIGCLWTNVALRKAMRDVDATAEIPSFQGNKWAQERAKMQMRNWFGKVPDFLITVFGPRAIERSDLEFCALSRHELLHCCQALDFYGCPKFDRDGNPKFAIGGHDVEEHVIVVEDFGIYAGAGRSLEFFEAAKRAPKVAPIKISIACGCCLR